MPDKKQGDKPDIQRDRGQFGADGQAGQSGLTQSGVTQSGQSEQSPTAMDCSACEAALADALDGLLDPAAQRAFDEHAGICEACGQTVADARRGLAWLEILKKAPPEPDATLVARILAQTSGNQTIGNQTSASQLHAAQASAADARGANSIGAISGSPMALHGAAFGNPLQTPIGAFQFQGRQAGWSPGAIGPDVRRMRTVWDVANMAALGNRVRQTVLQPRLAMTVAMAFFSITLTLNLTGVRLADLKPSNLKPSSLRRSFYEANAHVVRNLDNLRVVYEVEARVRDLRRASEPDDAASGADDSPGSETAQPTHPEPSTSPDKRPDGAAKPGERKQPKPQGNGGTSRRESGGEHSGRRLAMYAEPSEQAQPKDSGTLEGFCSVQEPTNGAQQRAEFAKQRAIKTGLYRPIEFELTESTGMQEVVPRGLFFKSGMPARRMA